MLLMVADDEDGDLSGPTTVMDPKELERLRAASERKRQRRKTEEEQTEEIPPMNQGTPSENA